MAKLPAEKQRILDEMKSFLEGEERWLREIMDHVGWNIEDLTKITQNKSPTYELCPFNNEHRVPHDSMEAHISKCWKKHGTYPDASSDVSSFNDDSASTSKTVDLSSVKPSNECSSSTSRPSTSLIELLTAERDAKRRRATYRKKGVSTNKKSYNEVLRELIANEMKTLEFGLGTDDESKSSLTLANEERATKKSAYAGIGNWIYHGNPYKRWMTIEDEERKLLRSPDKMSTDKIDSYSKYPVSRHSREDRPRSREYADRSPKRQRRSPSYRYGHRSSDSSRQERSQSDRHEWERDERNSYWRFEQRHFEDRRKSDFSCRRASTSGAEIPNRQRSSRRSPSKDHKCHKYDEDFDRKSNKTSEMSGKRKSPASSKNRESTENSIESVGSSQLNESPSEFDVTTKKHKVEAKSSVSYRRSSSSSDVGRKHHKKKKKHKRSKKKKRRRSSSQSSS